MSGNGILEAGRTQIYMFAKNFPTTACFGPDDTAVDEKAWCVERFRLEDGVHLVFRPGTCLAMQRLSDTGADKAMLRDDLLQALRENADMLTRSCRNRK
jgi:hypothetical protein